MIDWEAVRDEYVERFGPLHASDAVTFYDVEQPRLDELYDYDDDEHDYDDYDSERALKMHEMSVRMDEVLFFGLGFWNSEKPADPVTYASFGAVDGGAGNEFFLRAATPFDALDTAVRELAASAPQDLKPLKVIRHDVRFTLFDAMLVLPVEEGTFVLGRVEGALRHAFRLVPITAAERVLAARDPQRLLDLLRAAGAPVTDPFRACVVEPHRDGGRRANTAAMLAMTKRSVENVSSNHGKMVAMNTPESIVLSCWEHLMRQRATLAFIEARLPAILPEPDAPELLPHEARTARFSAVYRGFLCASIDPYRSLVPPRVFQVFRVFMHFVVSTHPLLFPIVYEAAMGDGRRPANTGDEDSQSTTDLIEVVASVVAGVFPSTSKHNLLELGKETSRSAKSSSVPEGSVSRRVHLWCRLVPALCSSAADIRAAEGHAVKNALIAAADRAIEIDTNPALTAGPAPNRLARLASSVSKGLYGDYLRAMCENAMLS